MQSIPEPGKENSRTDSSQHTMGPYAGTPTIQRLGVKKITFLQVRKLQRRVHREAMRKIRLIPLTLIYIEKGDQCILDSWQLITHKFTSLLWVRNEEWVHSFFNITPSQKMKGEFSHETIRRKISLKSNTQFPLIYVSSKAYCFSLTPMDFFFFKEVYLLHIFSILILNFLSLWIIQGLHWMLKMFKICKCPMNCVPGEILY